MFWANLTAVLNSSKLSVPDLSASDMSMYFRKSCSCEEYARMSLEKVFTFHRLDVDVELVLHHDVDERLGPVGEHAADVVPVEAVEEVAPVLEVHRQRFRVEPVVYSLGNECLSAICSPE